MWSGSYNASRDTAQATGVAARLSGYRWSPFDPGAYAIVRMNQRDGDAWLRETVPASRGTSPQSRPRCGWLQENGLRFAGLPSALIGDEPDDLFARATDNWREKVGWRSSPGIRTLGPEGGCRFTVGRRRES